MAKLKTKDELLKDLSKANKTRKEVLANRAGFGSVDAYRLHLQGISTEKVTETKKPVIHLVNILDASGSMQGGKFDNAVEGIYKEVEEFKGNVEVDYKFSFIKFSYNSDIKTVNFNAPLNDIVRSNHLRAAGYTALNQAVGETLERVKALENDDRVLVSIFTDGEENDSKGKYADNATLKKLIEDCQALGMTITFIGTEGDVKTVNRNLGVDKSNTLVHENTAKSVEVSFRRKLASTQVYANAVTRGVSKDELLVGFYQKSTGKL